MASRHGFTFKQGGGVRGGLGVEGGVGNGVEAITGVTNGGVSHYKLCRQREQALKRVF